MVGQPGWRCGQWRMQPNRTCLRRTRSDVPCMQSSLCRSLQRAEAVLRTRLNPGLRWLLKHKHEDVGSDPEGLPSRSARRLRRLEQCMLGAGGQWQALRECPGAVGGCVRARCPPEGAEFQHVGPQGGRLQALLEERARLLFLHEFALRYRASAAFVRRLAGLLEREGGPPGAGGVRALCEELRGLSLTEEYLRGALGALGGGDPAGPSAESLEDTLGGAEAFSRVAGGQGGVGTFPAARLLQVLGEHRGRAAAQTLHRWAAGESGPLHGPHVLHAPPRTLLGDQADRLPCPLNPPVEPPRSACPLAAFVTQDQEFTERLFQALLSSTDLLAPHVPNRPAPDRPRTADPPHTHPSGGRGGRDSERDRAESEACAALAARYRRALWTEFSRALLSLLYCPPHNCMLGSLNQCSDQTALLLVTELRGVCSTVSLPGECEGSLNDLCTQIITKPRSVAGMQCCVPLWERDRRISVFLILRGEIVQSGPPPQNSSCSSTPPCTPPSAAWSLQGAVLSPGTRGRGAPTAWRC
ncbi:hypothetical protein AAFF_G00313820 [Aldrovandia affinis]|uniref:Coiled-coil protein 142 C-terminal domain-containing protein n=1 Tax=Aldrovandia affinis TaxID=143900 RepID=A0AAD7R7S1_9TELE|nr:hypothetical protein AAFF_G00313820 [Aldrovandia affinis]